MVVHTLWFPPSPVCRSPRKVANDGDTACPYQRGSRGALGHRHLRGDRRKSSFPPGSPWHSLARISVGGLPAVPGHDFTVPVRRYETEDVTIPAAFVTIGVQGRLGDSKRGVDLSLVAVSGSLWSNYLAHLAARRGMPGRSDRTRLRLGTVGHRLSLLGSSFARGDLSLPHGRLTGRHLPSGP